MFWKPEDDMDKVRVGIVGSKFAADFHCDAYSRNEHARVVAVAAIDNLEEIARKWRIPDTYGDYHEMLARPDIDLVSVCVPNFLHHPVVMAAAAAGKHVVCEKPLATNVADAREMVRVCAEKGVKLMYAEDWCFCPALRRAQEIIAEGGIGQVFYVKAKEVHLGTHSAFAKNKEMCGGGSFLHLGVHPIGYLLHLLGRGENPVVEVTGKMTGGLEENFLHKANGGEDFGMGMMRFASGQFAFVEGNYITVGGMQDEVEVYGSEGLLRIDLTFGSPIRCYSRRGIGYAIEKTDFTHGWTRPAVDEFFNLGYVPELAFFVDCVRFDRQPFYGVDGRAGLTCIELVQAFYESNARGRTVRGRWL
jgi:predicted dehydrogenase